jgi:signal transduction histidine kinase
MNDAEPDKEKQVTLDLTLLANFTHQVINPLNAVAGTLDNITDGSIGVDRRDQRTRAARAQLENCITLIRNLAYLASGDNAFSPSEDRKIKLPQVIIEAAMFYQEEGSKKNIEINLKNRSDQNMLKGHVETLRQVLMNLFDNSIKYSRRGSEVKVHQWIQKDTNMAIISVRSEPERVLSNEDLDKLFLLGFRGSNARNMIASGTGLGLHICKHLVETKHNGSISVQKDGTGLLFTIKLPGAWVDNGKNH